jgi:cobalt/nickel transport system permease protein
MFINRMEIDKNRFPLFLLNRLDPRPRFAAGIVFIALAMQISNYKILAAIFLGALAVLITNARVVWMRLIPVNAFALTLFASLPAGELLTSALNNTEPVFINSIHSAVVYAARINIAALLYMIFIIPMGISNLNGVLSKMGAPPKLITLLFLTYRFIFILQERIFTAVLSLRLRKPKTMPKLTEFRAYAAIFAAAIISAELRSRKIMTAMYVKGFDGLFPVTVDWTCRQPGCLSTNLRSASFALGLQNVAHFTFFKRKLAEPKLRFGSACKK